MDTGSTPPRHLTHCSSQNRKDTLWYCTDYVSFCNIYVIQQDTQDLMINFIHNIQ